MCIHPVNHTLMIHLQVSCDPPEINPIHCHLHGLFTHRIGIALWRWLWRVSASAGLTTPALTTRIIQACFDLLSGFLTIWALVHTAILPTSPYLDTPDLEQIAGLWSRVR